MVLDEAQTIKNPNAATTRQALQLKAGQRLCLSGTPLQNHLGELWSLFDFLAPGFLGSARQFPHPLPHADREARRSAPAGAAEQAGEAVPAAPDQGGSGGRTAAEDRDLRARGDGERPARRVRGNPPGNACAGAGGDRREGAGAVGHHHPGCAAEDAAGLLRPAAAEAGGGAQDEGGIGQAGAADGHAAGDAGGRPPRAAVLPVHRDAGADPRSGCARRGSPTCC